jgi:hypothetical protein
VAALTLDRTVRLLEAALAEAELALPRAIWLVTYHIRRNATAKASHDKTRRAKHKDVIFVRL